MGIDSVEAPRVKMRCSGRVRFLRTASGVGVLPRAESAWGRSPAGPCSHNMLRNWHPGEVLGVKGALAVRGVSPVPKPCSRSYGHIFVKRRVLDPRRVSGSAGVLGAVAPPMVGTVSLDGRGRQKCHIQGLLRNACRQLLLSSTFSSHESASIADFIRYTFLLGSCKALSASLCGPFTRPQTCQMILCSGLLRCFTMAPLPACHSFRVQY